jgi:uncharacterized protein (DUF1499 family)
VLRRLAIAVAAVALAGLLVTLAPGREVLLDRVFSFTAPDKLDFATLRLHERPNQYLVCPPGVCAALAHRQSPVATLPVEKLEAKWEALVARTPGATMLSADKNLRQFDVVARTPRLRFPDLVTVRFIALDGERSTVAVYSRSVYGRSDFGANRARVDAWLAELALGG